MFCNVDGVESTCKKILYFNQFSVIMSVDNLLLIHLRNKTKTKTKRNYKKKKRNNKKKKVVKNPEEGVAMTMERSVVCGT